MKLHLTLLLLFSSSFALSQTQPVKLEKASAQKEVGYKGAVKEGWKWKDKAGENLIFLTETGLTQTKGEDSKYRDARITANHYVKHNEKWKPNWQEKNWLLYCQQEKLEVGFVQNGFEVTDLDKDGNSEVWIMHRGICGPKAAPAIVRITMHETTVKYEASFKDFEKELSDKSAPNALKFDHAFNQGNSLFRDFATERWKN